jgi:type 1 glutamine amidotransferase
MKSILLAVVLMIATIELEAQKQFKALVITTTRGWHHESLHAGFIALQQMAARNYFDLKLFEDNNSFTDEKLQDIQVIIFLNTTGNVFDSAQQKVMERFIQSGRGYVGIHSASDTEYDWEWYTKLVGRMFVIHPAIQTAKLQVLDKSFPGLKDLDGLQMTEEYYQFTPEKISGLHYILGVDETTYNPKADWKRVKGDGMGEMHPLAWYHEYDGGRSFYTALGHVPSTFSNQAFLDHLYAGIFWAATGRK